MASLTYQHQRKIEIPYGTGDEVLEVEVDRLPEPHESVGILQEQDCKINLWIQLALEYYRQGKSDAFELLLSTCLSRWDQNRVKSEHSSYPESFNDRVKALDLLAIYYVRKGYQAKTRESRRDYFAKAAQKFTEVDKSDLVNKHGSEYQFHLLGRAYCCLMEGRNDQADAQFNFVIQQQHQSGTENVPSLLGRACIEFNKKETSGKRAALSLYKKALQICPQCPADVRLGLAICFYKLNMLEKAEQAFSKVLKIDPKNVGALTGLAVIELNKKTNTSIKRGIEHLSKAFKIEPTNPMVLTLLADHFFYANDFEKVIKLANRAMENTESDAMQAQVCYQLARAYHRQCEYDKAFEFYYKSTQYGGSQSSLAFYGLGQMYIFRKENDSAIQAFETVLKANPDNFETLEVLASLYARSNSNSKKELAREYLKKVTEMRPENLAAWVELASLCEQHDTQTALNAYKTSISLHESKSLPVPPELYNNVAALLFSLDQLDESEKYYNLALQRCCDERQNNEEHYDSISYTIKYNMGRLYEAQHLLTKAEKTYKDLLVANSRYIDCYLRLGCMERDRGNLYGASELFKETFRTDVDNMDAWCLIGNLHLYKSELGPGQKKFERLLDASQSHPDSYSLVSVGNVYLRGLYQQQVYDKEKMVENQNRALRFFRAGLRYEPKNIYAANGIGCIFATKGMFNEAREVFSEVREATADFPDVWINIAHIYVEQRQYAAAVQMYENCLQKFYNNSNIEILLYIARALFKAKKLTECKKVLLRARHIEPHDLLVLFNLAKVLKTLARNIFEDGKSNYQTVVDAECELKLAKSYLEYYAKCPKDKSHVDFVKSHHLTVNSLNIEVETESCHLLLLQVEASYKKAAEVRDKEEARRRKEHEEQAQREMARKAEEEERRVREEKQRREELEIKRRELLKKQEEAKQKMSHDDSGTLKDEEGSDDGSRRKKSRSKKKEKSDREKPEKERPAERESKKFKSRAILSSDSSSSSEDDGALV